MALISSPTTLSLHNYSYPSMFNNIRLAKKTIPTCCFTIKARCSSSSSSSVNNNTNTLHISRKKISNNNVVALCSSSSPWLMLPPSEAKNNESNTSQLHTLYGRCFYDIVSKSFVPKNPNTSNLDQNHQESLSDDVKCVGSSHGWLAFIDRSDCSLYLCNRLTTQTIELPHIETLPAFRSAWYRKLDDGSFKITGFVCKNCCCDGHGEELKTSKEVADFFVEKIIMTSSPLEKECVVILSAQNKLTPFAFCKIGDEKWTNLDEAEGHFWDVVYRSKDNKIYAAQSRGMEVWDLSDVSSPERTTMLEYEIFCYPKVHKTYTSSKRNICSVTQYLVESSSGKLLMVTRLREWNVSERGKGLPRKDHKSPRYPYKTLRFDVFEFVEEENKFDQVEDLGGMALFVGINHSMAVNASEVPGIIPNAIYFGDEDGDVLTLCYNIPGDRPYPLIMSGGHDFGIYNVEDESFISPCYSTESKQFLPPPIWIVP